MNISLHINGIFGPFFLFRGQNMSRNEAIYLIDCYCVVSNLLPNLSAIQQISEPLFRIKTVELITLITTTYRTQFFQFLRPHYNDDDDHRKLNDWFGCKAR